MTGMDIRLENTDPRYVFFQLDTHWVQSGGGHVVSWIYKAKGRMKVVHFKDYLIDRYSDTSFLECTHRLYAEAVSYTHLAVYKRQPYHGAMYAVIHSLAKIACAGGDYAKARLTMQEYFQRMTEDPTGWGKPMAALLGAYEAQKRMGTPGIGGKDSMSGTFNDVSVPPTLVSIAVGIAKASQIGSPEFKQAGGAVALLPVLPGADGMIDFEALKANLERVGQLVGQGQVQAAATVGQGCL